MNKILHLAVFMAAFSTATCQTSSQAGIPNFKWMKEVGAKTMPAENGKVYYADDFGAVGDAVTMCTEAIQKAIDSCAVAGGGKVSFHPGIFLSGSIFIKSGVILDVPKGTQIIGSQSIDDYSLIETRVAGIEMRWPAALVNIIGQKNAAITGNGVIHGRGKPFWDKYREMRKEYDPKGLRWVVDYDCQRPRGILVADSENITLRDVVLYQPGFWSVHVLYSQFITIDGMIISNNIEGRGPSTDGIDIDSSSKILVQNCHVNCNDDNFCLKAGRDADGLRVNRPCEYVLIRNCVAGHGDGLFTIGSETSGGIRHIVAYNLTGLGTKYGLRFKSTKMRGGIIEDIHLANITMKNVQNPFIVEMNWHPSYSTSLLPQGYNPDTLPDHWKKLLLPVDPEKGMPTFRNIHFSNIAATGAQTGISVDGIEGGTIEGFSLDNVNISAVNAGHLCYTKNWTLKKTSVTPKNGNPIEMKNTENIKF